ncbi:MAG: HupE/UreJ family protein [Acidobacteriota bacterium]
MIRRRGRLVVALLALAWWATATRLAGHELERTRVALTFAANGAFTLEIANDPAWLLLRLEPFLEDYPDIPPRSPDDALAGPSRDARLAALAPVMRDRIVLFVDGREVRPDDVRYVPPVEPVTADGTPAPGRYVMRGRLAPDARQLRWFYGIVADPYPLIVARADGRHVTEWVGGTVWSGAIDLTGQFVAPTRWAVLARYVGLGVTHILPKGLDHILFVLGLFLLSTRVRTVLLQVTAFTVAHSITLALSVYGVVALPAGVVEPLIALSIAYVAVENLVTRELKVWRLGLVFLFGLLHGLGFAGVLRDLGLPRGEFVTALLGFNVGVEIGQVAVIGTAALLAAWCARRTWYRARVVVPASVAIAAIGVYWTIARALAP